MLKTWVIWVMMGISGGVFAQGLSGTSGLFNIPSAEMAEDRTLMTGAHFLHRDYGSYKYGRDQDYQWHALATYASLAFMPWMELQFRYTHLLGREISQTTRYFPDRMISVRVRVLAQGRVLPALVLGLQDMSYLTGGEEGNAYFASNYIVASRKEEIGGVRVHGHLGYALPQRQGLKQSANEGVFGGISLGPVRHPGMELIVEHDSRRWNVAGKVLLFGRLQVLGGLYAGRAFAGGLSWRTILD